jgi:hypothetical protein
MADQGTPERLEATVAGQTVNLVTNNLPFILMLALVGIGGYLLYQAQDTKFQELKNHHLYIVEQCHQTAVLIGEFGKTTRGWFATLDYNLTHPGEPGLDLDLPPALIVPPHPPAPHQLTPLQREKE